MKTTSNVYLLGFMFTLCMVIIDSSCYSNYLNRHRATRGFKNAALSAARGFGKRDGVPSSGGSDSTMDFNKGAPAVKSAPDDLSAIPKGRAEGERYLINWLAEQLAKNPHLARIILKKLFDKSQTPPPPPANPPADDKSSDEFGRYMEY